MQPDDSKESHGEFFKKQKKQFFWQLFMKIKQAIKETIIHKIFKIPLMGSIYFEYSEQKLGNGSRPVHYRKRDIEIYLN